MLYLDIFFIFGFSKFNQTNMIEQTFYFALAANWLMQNPVWQNMTAQKWVKNPKYKNVYAEEIETLRDSSRDMVYPRALKEGVDEDYFYQLCDKADKYDQDNNRTIQGNWFARKPLTCLYCITFWLVVLSVLLRVVLFGSVPEAWPVMFTAPVVAVAWERWFKSLPVKF